MIAFFFFINKYIYNRVVFFLYLFIVICIYKIEWNWYNSRVQSPLAVQMMKDL